MGEKKRQGENKQEKTFGKRCQLTQMKADSKKIMRNSATLKFVTSSGNTPPPYPLGIHQVAKVRKVRHETWAGSKSSREKFLNSKFQNKQVNLLRRWNEKLNKKMTDVPNWRSRSYEGKEKGALTSCHSRNWNSQFWPLQPVHLERQRKQITNWELMGSGSFDQNGQMCYSRVEISKDNSRW